MDLSPVVVFVYNRPKHTEIVLQSLSECQYADQTVLYIFADQAKNENAREKVEQVRHIIRQDVWKEKFLQVHVIEAEKNKGLANSVISGVTQVISQYGKVIVVEDDNRVAPDFLDYMNRALQFYQSNSRIGIIGGYTVPIKFPSDYNKDIFAMGRTSSYAWATWLDRWEKVDWEVKDYAQFHKDKHAQHQFAEYGEDRPYILEKQVNGKMNSWAIRFSYAMFKNNWISILPVKTRVENIGFDNSGVHNVSQDTQSLVKIESNLSPVVFENVEIDPNIKKRFVKLFKIPFSIKVKRSIKEILKR